MSDPIETLRFETLLLAVAGPIATITLNRPDVLNALSQAVMTDLTRAIEAIDADPRLKVSILTGAGRAFAAGADISEMAGASFSDLYLNDHFALWDRFARARKPLIAAVNGFALGGGCELTQMCDIVIASDKAKFGQPEIRLGITPGMGGSVRLTKMIGKARAMDMILTGRMIEAEEAFRIGLISRLVRHEALMETALEVAHTLAGHSLPSLMAAKEMIAAGIDLPTEAGLRFERRLFMGLFGTEDRTEGMSAFLEKRPAQFKDR